MHGLPSFVLLLSYVFCFYIYQRPRLIVLFFFLNTHFPCKELKGRKIISISHFPPLSRYHLHHVSFSLFILVLCSLTVSFLPFYLPRSPVSPLHAFPLLSTPSFTSLLSLFICISDSLLFTPLSLSGPSCSWSHGGCLSSHPRTTPPDSGLV